MPVVEQGEKHDFRRGPVARFAGIQGVRQSNRRARLLLGTTLLLVATPLAAQAPATPDLQMLRRWITSNHRTPEDYVIASFARRDVVLLGEFHKLRKDPALVTRLIPRLYANGIRHIALEFVRRVDQPLIDSLVLRPEWNEALANELLLRNEFDWGFTEYRDILQAVWQFNQARQSDLPPARLIGLNSPRDPSFIADSGQVGADVRRSLIWLGYTERDWTDPIIEAVRRGHKVLGYMGMHHAFTAFRQPIVVEGRFIRAGDVRAGNALRHVLGDRVMTIGLHAIWSDSTGYEGADVPVADGWIDAIFDGLPREYQRAGFDLAATPIGGLPGRTSVYRHGTENFTIGHFADGWIFDGGLETLQPVRPIVGFYTERNLYLARAGAWDPAMRMWSVEQFAQALAEDADTSAARARRVGERRCRPSQRPTCHRPASAGK